MGKEALEAGDASVTVFDINKSMLAVGEERAQKLGRRSSRFLNVPGIFILAISPRGGGEFLFKLKTGTNLKDFMKKEGKRQRGKRRKRT